MAEPRFCLGIVDDQLRVYPFRMAFLSFFKIDVSTEIEIGRVRRLNPERGEKINKKMAFCGEKPGELRWNGYGFAKSGW